MSTSAVRPTGGIAREVWFDETRMHVRLADGREVAVPLEWFPRLRDAMAEDRKDWKLIGGGVGIHWNRIDEDLSVAGLLGG